MVLGTALKDKYETLDAVEKIINVKAAQEDYVDTSFVLRQASPYMKIKFYLQENNKAPCLKRKPAIVITERSKKRKVNTSEVPLIDGEHVVRDAAAASKISEKDSAGEEKIGMQGNVELHVELQKIKRSGEVMRNFAIALLSTVKQYKDKLKESENEVRYLKESLRKQSAQAKDIEKELNKIRNPSPCRSNPPVEECAKAFSFNHGNSVPLIPSDPEHVQDADTLHDENNTSLVDLSAAAYSSLPLEENAELSYQYLDDNPESFQKPTQSYMQVGEMDHAVMNLSDVADLIAPHGDPLANECGFVGKTSNQSDCFPQPIVPREGEGCLLHLHEEEISIMQAEKEQSELNTALVETVQQSSTFYSTKALKSEEDDPSLRPLNSKRPKRKLLPASAIYFEDFNGLFMDENDMTIMLQEVKRKKSANVKARSDGSLSLIRILKNNLPR